MKNVPLEINNKIGFYKNGVLFLSLCEYNNKKNILAPSFDSKVPSSELHFRFLPCLMSSSKMLGDGGELGLKTVDGGGRGIASP
jgi:hypothetical protein